MLAADAALTGMIRDLMVVRDQELSFPGEVVVPADAERWILEGGSNDHK